MRNNWKKALYYAAEQAYISEVIDTQMKDLVIGDGKDYASKEDWIEDRIAQWLEDSK